MSDLIQIKRGPGAPASLKPGELGWDLTNKKLYCGDSNNTPVEVGGNAITLPLSIAEGGTGATSAATARTNLGALGSSDNAETITLSISKTSGAASVDSYTAYRYGKVIHVNIDFAITNGSLSAGNVFEGTLSNHLPIADINNISYWYTSIFSFVLRPDGSIVFRKMDSATHTVTSKDIIKVGFCYIEANS